MWSRRCRDVPIRATAAACSPSFLACERVRRPEPVATTMATRRNPRSRARSTTGTCSGSCSCCPRACCCWCSSPIRSGLGTWLGFTDAKIGRAGRVGRPRQLRVPLGRRGHAARALQHALLYGRRERHQVRARAVARAAAQQAPAVQGVLPRHRAAAVHRAHGAVGDRVLVDLRLAVLDHQLGADADGPHRHSTSISSASRGMRASRRSPPTSGAACRSSRSRCSPDCRRSRRRYYEAASLDGASPWQQFRYVTLPLLTPIIAVVMTFSVLFTFTDFQLIYVLTRGGPLNATHLMATLVVPARDLRRQPGRGRGDRDGDGAVPAGGDPVQLLRPAAPRLAAGRQRQMSDRRERAIAASRDA